MRMRQIAVIACWFSLTAAGLAADPPQPAEREWKVGSDARKALVCIPPTASKESTPLVFAFHGHGGTMGHAARTFAYQKQWPEAIVVYMQGLNTPGKLTDPEGKKSGWQPAQGDQQDRDLKFFDAVLASLKSDYKVDEKRIYATGHSNGNGNGQLPDRPKVVSIEPETTEPELYDVVPFPRDRFPRTG